MIWEYVQDPPAIGAPVCGPPSSCVIPFSLQGSSAGAVDGTTTQSGSAVQLPDGSLYANSTLLFTGTIEGCGTGTIAMRSTGYNRNGVTSGEIAIVDGSGTDGLVGVAGNGTVVDGQADPAGSGGSRGRIDLDVTC